MSAGIHVLENPTELARAAAKAVADAAGRAVKERGVFRIALAGGSTPRALHETLVRGDGVEWARTQVFFGDERCVPPDDEASNYRMAKETLLDRVPVREEAVHRIRGELSPEEAALLYESDLRTAFLGEAPRMDLVLLGLGTDGHTASLFPGSLAIEEEERLALAAESPVPPTDRVTLTLPAINAAREIVFLVSGEEKAQALGWVVRDLMQGGRLTLPAARVRPKDGRVMWLADRDATPFLRPGGGV